MTDIQYAVPLSLARSVMIKLSELKALAKRHGIKRGSLINKHEIIAIIDKSIITMEDLKKEKKLHEVVYEPKPD